MATPSRPSRLLIDVSPYVNSVAGAVDERAPVSGGAPGELPGAPPIPQDSNAESMYSSTLSPVTTGAYSRMRPGISVSTRSDMRSEEHTSELQSRFELVCRL